MLKHDFSARYCFKDWPNKDIPPVAAGVYLIWDGEDLIYVGMSGRQIEKNLHKRRYGLYNRLQAHSSGRLSGDQFCVYVANRFVIPSLKAEELPLFASGKLTLDARTKTFIHDHLDYAYALVETSAAAYELERTARRGDVFGTQNRAKQAE